MRQRGRAQRLARACAFAFATASASPVFAAPSDDGGAGAGGAGASPGGAGDAGGAGGLATDGGSPERYDVDPSVVPPGVVLFSNPGESGAPGSDWTARGDGACAARSPRASVGAAGYPLLLLLALAAARRRRG